MALSVRIPQPMRDLSSSEWKRFLQEFQIYLVATQQEFESERVKTALFLNFSGSEALKLFEVKLKSENIELSEVYDYFEDFCNESASEIFERYCFYKLKQIPGQKFSDFFLLLKHQAARCDFAEEDNMIRDAILFGVHDNDLREKLLNSQDLSLEEAEKECKRFESTSTRLRFMAESAMMEEHFLRLNSEMGAESVSAIACSDLAIYRHLRLLMLYDMSDHLTRERLFVFKFSKKLLLINSKLTKDLNSPK